VFSKTKNSYKLYTQLKKKNLKTYIYLHKGSGSWSHLPWPNKGVVETTPSAYLGDAGGSESDDVELSDCTLMALRYLEQADQRKIGKKS
jgi:hypothetical protein